MTLDECKDAKFEKIRNSACIIIEVAGQNWIIHQFNSESVLPISMYPTARAAASRVLQLMHVGPVAPQTHPETACLGSIDKDNPAVRS